jgi:hypothetical protein
MLLRLINLGALMVVAIATLFAGAALPQEGDICPSDCTSQGARCLACCVSNSEKTEVSVCFSSFFEAPIEEEEREREGGQ